MLDKPLGLGPDHTAPLQPPSPIPLPIGRLLSAIAQQDGTSPAQDPHASPGIAATAAAGAGGYSPISLAQPPASAAAREDGASMPAADAAAAAETAAAEARRLDRKLSRWTAAVGGGAGGRSVG